MSNVSLILAQTTESAAQAKSRAVYDSLTHFFETVLGLFSRGDALAQPESVVQHLQTLGAVWAVIFLLAGLLCLYNGSHYYRASTIALAFVIGSIFGYWLGRQIEAPLIVAGCVGLLLAVVAFPLMKYAVALLGGLAGAFVGANLWSGFAHAINDAQQATLVAPEAYWVGALVMLIICGMSAFILFKLSIVLFTSVSGSTVAVLGGLALLLSFEPVRASVTEGLVASRVVVPLLVIVPALIAFVLHQSPAPAQAGGDDD
jgi:hypothetical protein